MTVQHEAVAITGSCKSSGDNVARHGHGEHHRDGAYHYNGYGQARESGFNRSQWSISHHALRCFAEPRRPTGRVPVPAWRLCCLRMPSYLTECCLTCGPSDLDAVGKGHIRMSAVIRPASMESRN